MTKISNLYGVTISWEDPSEAIYEGLKTYGKNDEQLYNLGNELKNYVDQFVKELTIFLKVEDNKLQLQEEWTTAVLTVRIETDTKPFRLQDGKLFMETKPNYWNNYLTEFTCLNLEKILGLSDPMTLITKKNLKKNEKPIETAMAKISSVFGQELTWANNSQEIYEARITYGQPIENLYILGDHILSYVKQAEKEFIAFCKSADNKEALQEVLTGSTVGVRITDTPSAKSWIIEDGNLWMETRNNYWNNYLTEFTAAKLESIL